MIASDTAILEIEHKSGKAVTKTRSRIPVSAIMITCNEERNIRRTLSQLYWCDEIVVIDSFSTDDTIAICEEFGCKVFIRRFEGFGDQKRFALSKASNDWVLSIDADEVLSNPLIQEIQNALENNQEHAGFALRMNLVFLDKEFEHGRESGRAYLRLFNKQQGGFTDDKVHESIFINGSVEKLDNIIKHYSYYSLHQYLDKSNRYSCLSAEIAFKKGKNKSLPGLVLSLPLNFMKYYFLQRNFMNGCNGFYWSVLSTYAHFTKYVKLRQLHKTAGI